MSYKKFYQNDEVIKGDLHLHTTASDGRYSPEKVVEFAYEKGVRVLAITDHDTTAGLSAAKKKTQEYGLDFIPGIELSTTYAKHEVHILGYYIDENNEEMQENLQEIAYSRISRVKKIVSKIKELGYPLTYEDVKKKSSSGTIGRPHIALAMMDYGIINDVEEAFEKYLNPGCPAFVPRYRLTPQDAVLLITKAGGVPVLAHPGLDFPEHLLPELVSYGLKGIEVFHPSHSREIEENYYHQACHYELIITGGSDFHGHTKEDWQHFGEMRNPVKTIQYLKEMWKENSCD